MDILIISPFAGDFSKSDNDRFLYLANMLSENNHVEYVTSSFFHTTKQHREDLLADWPFKITYVDEPGYPKNVCVQRLYSHWRFGKNLETYLLHRVVPDVVYCAFPPLSSAEIAAEYCQQNNVRFVLDIQDLWPEAFEMVFRVPLASDAIFSPLYAREDAVFSAADGICAVSDTYAQRALRVNSKCQDAQVAYLGTDLDTFDSNSNALLGIDKNPEEIWLAYCGTLGESYDLITVFDALAILAEEGKIPPLFIVMGDGPRRAEFEQYATERNLGVVFAGKLSYDQMCSLLMMCDIAVNPIAHNAAQSIINKHADYAAAGIPVLSTQESIEYRDLVDTYQMGFNIANGDSYEFAERLWQLCEDKETRLKMGKSARRCAEKLFDRKRTYKRLVKVIKGCVEGRGERG